MQSIFPNYRTITDQAAALALTQNLHNPTPVRIIKIHCTMFN